MNLSAYSSLYDFTQLELAIQSFFVAQGFVQPPGETDATRSTWTPGTGDVAFFTGFEASLFQKARPRVACFLNGINPATTPPRWVADNNGALRNNLFRGNLVLEIITAANYTYHTALRAQVMALAEMIAPPVADHTLRLGANQYLTAQQINYVTPQNLDSSVAQEQGFYGSQLNYQLTFSIPKPAILGVVET